MHILKQDIEFENVRLTLLESKLNPVEGGNIDLRGCALEKQLFQSDIAAFYARYVNDLNLDDVHISWGKIKEDYFKQGILIEHFNGVKIRNTEATASPSNPDISAVYLEDGSEFKTDLPADGYQTKDVAGH